MFGTSGGPDKLCQRCAGNSRCYQWGVRLRQDARNLNPLKMLNVSDPVDWMWTMYIDIDLKISGTAAPNPTWATWSGQRITLLFSCRKSPRTGTPIHYTLWPQTCGNSLDFWLPGNHGRKYETGCTMGRVYKSRAVLGCIPLWTPGCRKDFMARFARCRVNDGSLWPVLNQWLVEPWILFWLLVESLLPFRTKLSQPIFSTLRRTEPHHGAPSTSHMACISECMLWILQSWLAVKNLTWAVSESPMDHMGI